MIDPSEIGGRSIALVAARDCNVLLIDSTVASTVISRSPALTAALDQIATNRRRRVTRVLRRHPLEPRSDEQSTIAQPRGRPV